MATISTEKMTATWFGMDFETRLNFAITDPNPAGIVTITWNLEGKCANYSSGVHPNGYSSPVMCGWIKGVISDSGSYSDSKESSVAVGKVWQIPLAEGDNFPGTPAMGHYQVWACCRISEIDDQADYLKVTCRNFLERRDSNYAAPLVFIPVLWSDTSFAYPKVFKKQVS